MKFDEDFKTALLASIPIVNSMGLDFDVKNNLVEVRAPLSKHINYEGTAFGGSINTVCVLSCYIMTKVIMHELQIEDYSLVIQDSRIKYINPVQTDFKAIAEKPAEERLRSFKNQILKKKIGRLKLESHIVSDKAGLCAEFYGRYVVRVNG